MDVKWQFTRFRDGYLAAAAQDGEDTFWPYVLTEDNIEIDTFSVLEVPCCPVEDAEQALELGLTAIEKLLLPVSSPDRCDAEH